MEFLNLLEIILLFLEQFHCLSESFCINRCLLSELCQKINKSKRENVRSKKDFSCRKILTSRMSRKLDCILRLFLAHRSRNEPAISESASILASFSFLNRLSLLRTFFACTRIWFWHSSTSSVNSKMKSRLICEKKIEPFAWRLEEGDRSQFSRANLLGRGRLCGRPDGLTKSVRGGLLES